MNHFASWHHRFRSTAGFEYWANQSFDSLPAALTSVTPPPLHPTTVSMGQVIMGQVIMGQVICSWAVLYGKDPPDIWSVPPNKVSFSWAASSQQLSKALHCIIQQEQHLLFHPTNNFPKLYTASYNKNNIYFFIHQQLSKLYTASYNKNNIYFFITVTCMKHSFITRPFLPQWPNNPRTRSSATHLCQPLWKAQWAHFRKANSRNAWWKQKWCPFDETDKDRHFCNFSLWIKLHQYSLFSLLHLTDTESWVARQLSSPAECTGYLHQVLHDVQAISIKSYMMYRISPSSPTWCTGYLHQVLHDVQAISMRHTHPTLSLSSVSWHSLPAIQHACRPELNQARPLHSSEDLLSFPHDPACR